LKIAAQGGQAFFETRSGSNRAILILMPTHNLTPEIINAAIAGFEQQKVRIDVQIAELRAMLPGGTKPTAAATPEAPNVKRRKFSAAARRRMKEAQQKRWAKIRRESAPPAPATTPETPKTKRKLSEEGRASIVAALKRRWAEKKAAMAKPKSAAKRTAGRRPRR
jgi:hypothetical protein